MAEFRVRTKGNSPSQGKARVYFTCHFEDFDRYFDKICEDVFSIHDCAIYYTEDMNEPLSEENIDVDLGRMNLFIVPVTYRLMSDSNRAMSVDIAYAKEHNIPILPFMMEAGLDLVYALPKNFGERQYLNPTSTDITEISYKEKLKKYLEAILISDEMAKRIKAAFDAYVFLSYRKKDRRYANELMRIIHNIPGCRDIAIWYDEFLTPGESFMSNIEKAMKKSELFTLLVTPNILEDDNFVMREEYPTAKKMGMEILPAELEETDYALLRDKYEDIPSPIRPTNAEFNEAILNTFSRIAISENDIDPEHNFLIGLAYLDGIDVEVDVERGIELITKAAEADLPEAMDKLHSIYSDGDRVQADHQKALYWSKRLSDFYIEKYGDEHPDSLSHLNELAMDYRQVGELSKALELAERVYSLRCKILGEEDRDTLVSLSIIATLYSDLEDYKKALELDEKVYNVCSKIFGDEESDTIEALINLASSYRKVNDHKKELEINEKAYNLCLKHLGEEHLDTFATLNNLASTYSAVGEYEKAIELCEKAYASCCKIYGEKHNTVLLPLRNLAMNYRSLGKCEKAIELYEKIYILSCEIWGEEHPITLEHLNNLSYTYGIFKYLPKALELHKKVCELSKKILGDEHPQTLVYINNLAFIYSELDDHQTAYELMEKVYETRVKVLGERDTDTLAAMLGYIILCKRLEKYRKALPLAKKLYSLSIKVFGEGHPETKKAKDLYNSLKNIIK